MRRFLSQSQVLLNIVLLLLLKFDGGFSFLQFSTTTKASFQWCSSLQPLFSTTTTTTSSSGMGMGMGKGKKTKKKENSSGKGMGNSSSNNNSKKKSSSSSSKSTTTSTPFDVHASLLRLEKKYEEIQQMSTRALHSDNDDSDNGDAGVASEMIVAVRATNSKKLAATGDWVPFANLCVHPHAEVSSDWVHAAISLYCRELSLCATQGAKLFGGVPRNELQYAIEPLDSFFKHVYDPLMKDQQKGTDTPMTKAEARQLLELDTNSSGMDEEEEEEDERVRIKKSYRRKSFQWHPDRLDLDNMSKEEQAHAAQQYARIQQAFGVLSSHVRSAGSSWYRSLGGRDRTDFQIIHELMSRDTASTLLEQHKVQTAIAGLDPDLVQLFVARNQAMAAASL